MLSWGWNEVLDPLCECAQRPSASDAAFLEGGYHKPMNPRPGIHAD